nr:putative ABC transporter permease [Isachenkonia alkalipeptolytica]
MGFWIAYFIIYSFLGWLLEVIHAYIERREWVNRGFIKGPFCPIYGFGVLLLLAMLSPIQENGFVLFLGAVILITLLEFVTGLVLETLFGAKWWEYQDEKYHIKGYVCPKYSLLFGAGALFTIKWVHPLVVSGVEGIPPIYLQAGTLMILTYLVVDFIQTVLEIIGLNRLLRDLQQKMEELQQLEIRETLLKERKEKLGKMEKQVEEIEVRMNMIKEHFKELRIEYEAMLRAGMGRYRRILKAFPKFRSKRFQKGYKKLKERFRSFRNGEQKSGNNK